MHVAGGEIHKLRLNIICIFLLDIIYVVYRYVRLCAKIRLQHKCIVDIVNKALFIRLYLDSA